MTHQIHQPRLEPALLAADLGEIGPEGGVRLTAKGRALCSRYQQEIDALPPVFRLGLR